MGGQLETGVMGPASCPRRASARKSSRCEPGPCLGQHSGADAVCEEFVCASCSRMGRWAS